MKENCAKELRIAPEIFESFLQNELKIDRFCLENEIKSSDFARELAKYLKIPFLQDFMLDEKMCENLPFSLLNDLFILPLKSEDENIKFACAKSLKIEDLQRLESFFRNKFISFFIVDFFKLQNLLSKLRTRDKISFLSQKLRLEWENNLKQEQSSISQIFEFILKSALELKASDIHIEAEQRKALVRIRIDGLLREFCELEKDINEALIFYIKFLARLNVAETRRAQDGNFEFFYEQKNYDFRLSTLPLLHGESLVIRILKHDEHFLKLENLNFSSKNLTLLKKAIKAPFGMILFTGPTGSGKSTSLYACLNEIKNISKKIITVEDPIEYKMPLIQQIMLNPAIGLDFSTALRAILRQDPDIIMVGEIRDETSLNMALKSSLTGHLLLSTLHTNDALSTIIRLLDMHAKPYLLASSLRLIIAQRLVRLLCPFCKVKSEKNLEFDGDFFKSLGCQKCSHSGFLGRELVAECLEIDEEMSELIRQNSSKKELKIAARKKGFKSMFELGLEKARAGLISLDEILRVFT